MFKQLKLWKNIVTLNSKFVLIQATTYVVSVFCAIISPIALSYFISFVSSSEFSLALLWLGIDLAIKLLEQLSWHFNYSNFTPPSYKFKLYSTNCSAVFKKGYVKALYINL